MTINRVEAKEVQPGRSYIFVRTEGDFSFADYPANFDKLAQISGMDLDPFHVKGPSGIVSDFGIIEPIQNHLEITPVFAGLDRVELLGVETKQKREMLEKINLDTAQKLADLFDKAVIVTLGINHRDLRVPQNSR